MAKRLRLYWLKETGCDTGTPIAAEDLDACLRKRVVELTGKDQHEIALYLPFMDRRECRRRAEVSRAMRLERKGDAICAIPANFMAALRDRAAMLVALNPAWRDTPQERDPRYFRTWQQASLALQRALRKWIPEMHFSRCGALSRPGGLLSTDRVPGQPPVLWTGANRIHIRRGRARDSADGVPDDRGGAAEGAHGGGKKAARMRQDGAGATLCAGVARRYFDCGPEKAQASAGVAGRRGGAHQRGNRSGHRPPDERGEAVRQGRQRGAAQYVQPGYARARTTGAG